ncbi:MAG: hypothetical protein ACOC6N_03040, partial [archaeon]|jgi:hypothetical protein
MGRHYSLTGGNLYIFTTGQDRLLDLGVFPEELNLFEAESAWRISPWIAVVENVLQKVVETAQLILQLNGYEKINLSSRDLEYYFLNGDEHVLLQVIRETSVELSPNTNLLEDIP